MGSGTGKFKDKRLFFAKQGHASLIPLMGLMKEAEFDGAAGMNLFERKLKVVEQIAYTGLDKHIVL